MGECYICLEDGALPTTCACKTFVHQKCLLRAVEAAGTTECKICLEKLPFKVATKSSLHITRRGGLFVIANVLLILAISAAGGRIVSRRRQPPVPADELAIFLVFVVPVIAFLAHELKMWRSGEWRLTRVETDVTVRRDEDIAEIEMQVGTNKPVVPSVEAGPEVNN